MQKIQNLFLRYVIILILGIKNFFILQKILQPLTLQTLHATLSIFTQATLTKNTIIIYDTIIRIIPACLATSAFYLLIILNLSTPSSLQKKIKAILFSITTLFILNITRILFLILIRNTIAFETTHLILWHLVSIILVVGIWIATTKIYKIKKIPVYTDVIFINSLIKKSK